MFCCWLVEKVLVVDWSNQMWPKKRWYSFVLFVVKSLSVVLLSRCDGCHTRPIVGHRYRCQVCIDFNFCEACFSTRKHRSHPFFKLTVPGESQFPLVLFRSFVSCLLLEFFQVVRKYNNNQSLLSNFLFSGCASLPQQWRIRALKQGSFFFQSETPVLSASFGLSFSSLSHRITTRHFLWEYLYFRCIACVCWTFRLFNYSAYNAGISWVTTPLSRSAWSACGRLE